MDLRSLTLKVNAHLLRSWLWFREPDRPSTGIRKQTQTAGHQPVTTGVTGTTGLTGTSGVTGTTGVTGTSGDNKAEEPLH